MQCPTSATRRSADISACGNAGRPIASKAGVMSLAKFPKAAFAFMVSLPVFRFGGDYQRRCRHGSAAAAPSGGAAASRTYFAATTMISTLYCGAASLASTVARAGVLPGDTQASHTAFISWNVFMSVM